MLHADMLIYVGYNMNLFNILYLRLHLICNIEWKLYFYLHLVDFSWLCRLYNDILYNIGSMSLCLLCVTWKILAECVPWYQQCLCFSYLFSYCMAISD